VNSADCMPRAYDNDLRRKLLAAHAAGKGSQPELALAFGVSLGWVEKILRQQRRSGQTDRIEQRHGPVSRVDAAAKACLLRAIEDRPDLTLAELQRILAEQQGVRLCIAQVWNVLKRLGVRLKKSRSTPPSATPRPTVDDGKSSSRASARSRRNT
jgi:transposase